MSRHTLRGTAALGLAAALALPLLLAPPTQARADSDQVAATAAALTKGDSVLLSDGVTDIAPGLTLTSFRRLQPGGWVTGHVMDADLTTESLSLDVADGGAVSGANKSVEDFARGSQAVAAVNGDYFDMNASDAPIGTNVSPTDGVRTLPGQARQTFTIADGKAAVQNLMSAATLTIAPGSADARTEKVAAVNSPTFATNTIGLFNAAWGKHPVTSLLDADEAVRVVTVTEGKVTATSDDRADAVAPTDQGTSVLVARGTAAATLADLAVGDAVDLAVQASADVDLAVGGAQRLLTDGKIGTEDQVTAARTAVGVSKDGASIKVVTVDGRAGDADGMTIQELAHFMADLGVWNAVNLDGGGSTTLVARPAGTDDLALVNRPSDGSQRLDSNALVFRSTATTPKVSGVRLRPSLQPAAGIVDPAAHAVLPGLSRTVLATGLDANLALNAESAPTVTSTGPVTVENVSGAADGQRAVLRGAKPGVASVTAKEGAHSDTTTIHVYGEVAALEPSTTLLALPDDQTTGTLRLTAVDGDGNRVPVETRDVQVKAAAGATVQPKGLDAFTVTPTAGAKTSSVTFSVDDHEVTVPVTIGTEDVPLANFATVSDWKVGTARATGTLSAATGPEGGPALALDFDFSTNTATRGMYAVPVTPIKINGQPQTLSMWINGTGKGEWPRLQVTKGDGTSTNLDGALIDWQGWRKVTFGVPAGTPYPLTLTAIRFMETRSTATYKDHLEIAELSAQVPAAVELPDEGWASDPSIITNGTVDDRPLRIATVSDTQFVARDPESELVKAGRRALQEVVAADADLLVINGDLVDEASPADFALAEKVITEEVGHAVPWIYVPGNHEIMGGPISDFEAVFGDTATNRVIKQTKIITLDSSTGTLHPDGSTDQLRMLESELAAVAKDPKVTGVVVFNHHPVDDPHADKASQLSDRYEASALADRLAEFRRTSGKSIAQVNGHVGVFHASALDGVTRVINGNSGKNPSGSADRGGFTGWSMVGVDPAKGVVGAAPTPVSARTGWLQVETMARVDALELSAPAALRVRETAEVTATVVQDRTRRVPVAWPVSAQWSGEGVTVPGERGNGRAVVEVDPATGELRGLRRGTATVTLTVNGVSKSAEVTVR
ncbi:phosphodiester glycosidase family protein [Propionibacteriaceae bacterium Y1685]